MDEHKVVNSDLERVFQLPTWLTQLAQVGENNPMMFMINAMDQRARNECLCDGEKWLRQWMQDHPVVMTAPFEKCVHDRIFWTHETAEELLRLVLENEVHPLVVNFRSRFRIQSMDHVESQNKIIITSHWIRWMDMCILNVHHFPHDLEHKIMCVPLSARWENTCGPLISVDRYLELVMIETVSKNGMGDRFVPYHDFRMRENFGKGLRVKEWLRDVQVRTTLETSENHKFGSHFRVEIQWPK